MALLRIALSGDESVDFPFPMLSSHVICCLETSSDEGKAEALVPFRGMKQPEEKVPIAMRVRDLGICWLKSGYEV